MKKIFKFNKKLDNRGSSIIMVVVSLAFIGIIIGALLSAASYAYRLKLQNLNAKDNFYYVEQAMQEIYAGVGANTIEEMKDAYVYTVENMVRYDLEKGIYVTISDEEANKMFKEKFMKNILDNPYFKQGADTLATTLQSYITNETVDLDNDKISLETVYDGSVLKEIIIKNVTLTRVQEYDKSAGNGTYVQTISTDIVISEPDFNVNFNNMASDYSKIFDYALVGDMGVEIISAELKTGVNTNDTAILTNSLKLDINGNIYAGADYYNKEYNTKTTPIVVKKDGAYNYTLTSVSSKTPTGTGEAGYVNIYALDAEGNYCKFDGVNQKSMNSGLYISGRDVSVMAETIIVPGTIAVMDTGNLSMYSSATEDLEVWTDNIVLGGKSNVDAKEGTYTGANLYVSGNLYVRDDTEINAKGSKVTLFGSYFGYGNSTSKDTRVFVPTVDQNNFVVSTTTYEGTTAVTTTENRGHYNSSSIVINGEASTLDLSQAKSLYLAGRAYIELSKKVDSSASTETVYTETYSFEPTYTTTDNKTNYVRDYKTGESISVKSNQLMYNVSNLGSATTVKVGGKEYEAVTVNTKYTDSAEIILGNKGFYARFFPIDIFGGNNVLVIKEQVGNKTIYYIDLATGFEVLNEVVANANGLYTAGQVESAARTLSATGTTEAAFVQSYVAWYEYNLENNPKNELLDVINYEDFDQGELTYNEDKTILYSSGAITTREETVFTLVTNGSETVPSNLLTDAAYVTNTTNPTAFTLSADLEKEYNYMKWNLDHYDPASTEKTALETIMGTEKESFTPINKYIVMANLTAPMTGNDGKGKETTSGYRVWLGTDDVTITGSSIINGIVIAKGNVTFASDVEEFNGMIVAGGKIYIGNKLTKLSASPSVCRGVIRDCIATGDDDAEKILKMFKEYENYDPDAEGSGGSGSSDPTSVNIDAITYTDVVSMTNWMKNVGGDYDDK